MPALPESEGTSAVPATPAGLEQSACADSAPLQTRLVSCGCGSRHDAAAEQSTSNGDRKAVAVDGDVKLRNQKRLRRIEGQVRGLQKMVDEDRYCSDILTQIASVHEALRAVGRELMRNHLKYCATEAIRRNPEEAEAMYDELVEMMHRYAR